jgi:hypothetical protein
MALDTHVEVTRASDGLGGLEVTIPAVALDDGVIAGVHTVGGWIENEACVAGQAVEVGGAEALFASGEAGFASVSGAVIVHAAFAGAITILLVVVDD